MSYTDISSDGEVVSVTTSALTLQDIAREAAKHGYAVVPVEPSDDITRAGIFARMNDKTRYPTTAVYRAMIKVGRIKPEDGE